MPRRANSIQQTSNRLQHITSNHASAVQQPDLDFSDEYSSVQRIISSAEANVNMPSVEAANHAMARIVCIVKDLPRRLDASATVRSKINALSVMIQIAGIIYSSRSYPFGWHLRASSRKAEPIRVFNETLRAILRGMNAIDASCAVDKAEIHGQSLYEHLTNLTRLDEWEQAFGVEEKTMLEINKHHQGSSQMHW